MEKIIVHTSANGNKEFSVIPGPSDLDDQANAMAQLNVREQETRYARDYGLLTGAEDGKTTVALPGVTDGSAPAAALEAAHAGDLHLGSGKTTVDPGTLARAATDWDGLISRLAAYANIQRPEAGDERISARLKSDSPTLDELAPSRDPQRGNSLEERTPARGLTPAPSRELSPMKERQNDQVLIDDEDHVAQRLWQTGTRFHFGSLRGEHPGGVDYNGVSYVVIVTIDERGDQRIFAVNNPVYGGDMSVVGRTRTAAQHGGELLQGQHFGQLAPSANQKPITVGQELQLWTRASEDANDGEAHTRQVGIGKVDRILVVYDTGMQTFMQASPYVESFDNPASRRRHAGRLAGRVAEEYGDDRRDYTLSLFGLGPRGAERWFSDEQQLPSA